MTISITTVLAATITSYISGSLWYLWLGKSWRHVVGWNEECPPYRPTLFELGFGLAGQIIMAVALCGILSQFGMNGVKSGVSAACVIWLGFIMPSLATNVIFQRRNLSLIWQDGLHWLLILTSQGFILGVLR